MAENRILVVVSDQEAAKAYQEALLQTGASYDVAPTFDTMAAMAMGKAYNGLLIDVLTLVRSRKEEKALAYDCMNFYPVMRVTWEAKRKRIKLAPLERLDSPDPESTLKHFIEGRCAAFAARPLRRHQRRHLNLNLLCSDEPNFSEGRTFRTFAVTVSQGGIFVHTLEEFREGSALWLRSPDLAEQPPIPATVRWYLAWGRSRQIAGVGLKFEELNEGQERGIARLLNL